MVEVDSEIQEFCIETNQMTNISNQQGAWDPDESKIKSYQISSREITIEAERDPKIISLQADDKLIAGNIDGAINEPPIIKESNLKRDSIINRKLPDIPDCLIQNRNEPIFMVPLTVSFDDMVNNLDVLLASENEQEMRVAKEMNQLFHDLEDGIDAEIVRMDQIEINATEVSDTEHLQALLLRYASRYAAVEDFRRRLEILLTEIIPII